MKARFLRWANSIHAHLLALTLVVILTLTAFSLFLLLSLIPPERVPVSVYEIARILKKQPLLREIPVVHEKRQAAAPLPPTDPAERLISALLARQLTLRADDVRVRLDPGDRERLGQFLQEMQLYGSDEAADPFILGTFTAAVRQRSGEWRLVTREARGGQSLWRLFGQNAFLLGLLLVIPLSLWFSVRLSRPIRAFAASAERLGAGIEEQPIPVEGPSEIRMAAQSLNEMQSRIARYVRERTSVVGAIAHDLRTPLSRLHFHLASAPASVRMAAEDEIRQMEQLIGTTLDFVDNESRPRSMDPLDLGLLVEGLVDDFADMGRDVVMTKGESITIIGDMLLLKRLFTNLFDNAIKYGDRAWVTVQRIDDMAIVDVMDDGPGMMDEQIARAFEPFYRGEPSRNRSTGGVGLGLSIVQSAVQAHDGMIALTSSVGGGLRVRVQLPIL
ncbi:HAMP domain-containing histidine kinase [Sphingobium sp. BYY-5]|uniref:sensor histidine kinase n=1 Tax=Sphingobium sp. BYY-5 TaxID=2926400 RepID=UPI001FA6BC0A|nr:HAMP domain-containing sensor histidine kinase [Sphingobium sp. BYY-5]MCI4592682.1 HAMP domain-containing histidine kinase [Sphingobium sp. BYY-5]